MDKIRVRFAPSPTGKLHIGSSRTTLFNYLFAKRNKGTFILRFEDTDQERSTKEFEKNIQESLKWLGLLWDEGPYRQMDRLDIYKKYAQKLLDDDKAYYCYCTKEELEKEKEESRKKNQPYRYSSKCCSLTSEQIETYKKQGRKPVLRFKINPEIVKFKDLIKGEISVDSKLIGDPIIMRTDGIPIYNLANVVDDMEMKITHVIRGEDLISSTPIQILLYKALGAKVPEFAHMPLTLAPDKTKLSKRHGAVSVLEYKEMGYLKEALINFLVLLGWHPGEGDTREFFTLADLEKEFSLERMGKSAAIFDIKRLNFINAHYIKEKSIDELASLSKLFLPKADDETLKKLVAISQSRMEKLTDLPELCDFYFVENIYKPELLVFKKSDKEKTLKGLELAIDALEKLEGKKWDIDGLHQVLHGLVEKNKLSFGDIFWPVRVALSGKENSPSPEELLWLFEKEESLRRIKEANNNLKSS